MDELISILLRWGIRNYEHLSHFVASASLIMVNVDDAVEEGEFNQILDQLAELKSSPDFS